MFAGAGAVVFLCLLVSPGRATPSYRSSVSASPASCRPNTTAPCHQQPEPAPPQVPPQEAAPPLTPPQEAAPGVQVLKVVTCLLWASLWLSYHTNILFTDKKMY